MSDIILVTNYYFYRDYYLIFTKLNNVINKLNRRILKMNNEEINELTAKIESCWDENNPRDVRSFDERLKQKLTPEEYELITSWR